MEPVKPIGVFLRAAPGFEVMLCKSVYQGPVYVCIFGAAVVANVRLFFQTVDIRNGDVASYRRLCTSAYPLACFKHFFTDRHAVGCHTLDHNRVARLKVDCF